MADTSKPTTTHTQETDRLYERIAELEREVARLRVCLEEKPSPPRPTPPSHRVQGEENHWHKVLQVFFIISEDVPKGIGIVDLDGKLLYANRTYHRMTGYEESLVGAHISTLYGEEQSYPLNALRQAAEQSFWEGVLTCKRRNGSTFKVLLSAFALRDSFGQARAIGCVVRDISSYVQAEESLHRAHAEMEDRVRERTDELSRINNALHAEIVERIRTEEALRKSEERYGRAVKAARVGVWDWDLQTNEIYLAPNLKELLGYADDEISNCLDDWNQLVHPDDMQRVMEAALAHVRGETPLYEVEHRMIHKNGTTRWFIVRGVVVRDAAGQPVRMSGTDTDITERKQTEEALNQSYTQLEVLNTQIRRHRDLLRTLFDGLEDGLLLFDHEGHIMIANQSFAALLDTRPSNLVGQPWQCVCQSTTPPFPGKLVFHTLHDGLGRQHRARITDSSGQVRIFDMQTLPLLSPDQGVDRVIFHVVDVTHNLQLQARVIENERFVASGRLAASVAHEINTPLQSIQNALDLLRVISEEEREEFLSSALGEIQRIGKIVRQLLDLYRPGTPTYGPVDVTTLIERILLLMGKQLKEQHVTVERRFVPGPPRLWGRADELSQVLLNLLINALDAMPNGGTLWVETRSEEHPLYGAEGQVFIVVIRDTGSGISPDITQHIFEPFVTTKENGTGLGLSISSQIVEHHGGTIAVESQPGEGSTFTIMLPLREKHQEMVAKKRNEQ